VFERTVIVALISAEARSAASATSAIHCSVEDPRSNFIRIAMKARSCAIPSWRSRATRLLSCAAACFWKEPEVIVDASRYFTQAKHLELDGLGGFVRGWGREIPAWTDLPLVPALYGFVFRTFGETRVAVQAFTTLLFAGTVLLAFRTGKALWDEEVGFAGGALLLAIPYLLTQVPTMLVDVPTMFFLTLATRQRFTDTTSGMRAANRRVIEMFSERYSPDFAEIESLQLAVREGLRVEEVPVRMLERAGGSSFLTPLRSAFFIFKGVVVLLVGQFRPTQAEAER